MNDPAAPKNPKGWPLAAISLLILLLAGFLVLKWRKKEEVPVLVKEAPKSVEISKPSDPVKPPPEKPIAETPATPPKAGDADFDQKVKDLKKALEAKNWDDAAAALDAARKLRADAAELQGASELIAEGRKKEEAERLEIARKAELQRKQDRA